MPTTIRNKLRIMEGNIILVPGAEPISTVTSVGNFVYNPYGQDIVHNFHELYPASYISLKKAMEVIPGHDVIWSSDYSYRFFVLPDGPPPPDICPCYRVGNWYDVMRINADVGNINNNEETNINELCSGFSYNWCKTW